MQNLPLAFGYLKIIEKQQPKYVDKLTLHITKLLQKLIKDHTSAAAEFNPGSNENRNNSLMNSVFSIIHSNEFFSSCNSVFTDLVSLNKRILLGGCLLVRLNDMTRSTNKTILPVIPSINKDSL